jgi:1,4-dihydroxy-2-naphthoate octaprenyltransferase
MNAVDGSVSRTRAWVMATRPQTLPAGISPVLVGTGLAVAADVAAPIPAIAALLGALLIQIGTNFANDYYDALKGADSADREGFTRVTASGLIDPGRVKTAMIATYAVAMVVGLYLVVVGGVPILAVGLASILAGVLYTGGPYPYGYRGLGDVFVFVFFGVVAVTGTYYVQAVASMADVGVGPLWPPPGSVPPEAVVASLPPAALATAVLVVNNVRDVETDRAAGKFTLAVYLGYRWSRVQFLALVVLAYAVPVWFTLRPDAGFLPLLPLASLPLAGLATRTVLTETDGPPLNGALERVGQTLFVHSLLFALGLALAGAPVAP